ncbi:hypothetical protein EJB05_24799, partial [Eragrostis curvula]
VEGLACLEGASEWCRKKAIVESDCLSVELKSLLVFLIRELKQISASLPDVVFQAVKRERNSVAHELAQLAKRTTHTAVWRTRAPRCVESLVAQECIPYVE